MKNKTTHKILVVGTGNNPQLLAKIAAIQAQIGKLDIGIVSTYRSVEDHQAKPPVDLINVLPAYLPVDLPPNRQKRRKKLRKKSRR